jgi:hypothetical protein
VHTEAVVGLVSYVFTLDYSDAIDYNHIRTLLSTGLAPPTARSADPGDLIHPTRVIVALKAVGAKDAGPVMSAVGYDMQPLAARHTALPILIRGVSVCVCVYVCSCVCLCIF